jgi:hypothetical protein
MVTELTELIPKMRGFILFHCILALEELLLVLPTLSLLVLLESILLELLERLELVELSLVLELVLVDSLYAKELLELELELLD